MFISINALYGNADPAVFVSHVSEKGTLILLL